MKNIQRSLIFFSILIVLFIPTQTFADTGDFYNKYKSHFTKTPEPYKKIIQSYDYETNSFECKIWDVFCMNEAMMYRTSIGLVKSLSGSVDTFVIKPNDILNNKYFKEYKVGLSGVSKTLLALFLMWHIAKMVAVRYADASDGMIALNDKLVMTVTLAILMFLYDSLVYYILQIQYLMVSSVLSNLATEEQIILTIFKYTSSYGFLVSFIIAFIWAIFGLAFLYRVVLFGFLYSVGPLAIASGLNEEFNYYSLWLRLMITNVITMFGQAMLFSLGFKSLLSDTNPIGQGSSFSIALVCFILALALPSILGQLGASTGTGRAIGTVAKFAFRPARG